MPVTATAAVGVAALLDALFAEPPARIHPVALFGRLVGPVDRVWSRPRLVGAVSAVLLPLVAAGLAFAFVTGTGIVARRAGVGLSLGEVGTVVAVAEAAVAALVLFSTTSLRMLTDEVRAVVDASASDLPEARQRLRALAGRDAASLSAAEVRSAAVESLAENLADGFVAPLAAFAVVAPVSVAAAAAAAAWVKAVNTLDSMLGYPENPHGRASARLDDLVMYLPARLSAALLSLAAADPGALVRGARAAHTPASPNSGWPMATLAAVLGVRLEKPGHYVLDGGPALPTVEEARRARTLVTRAGLLSVGLAGVIAWF